MRNSWTAMGAALTGDTELMYYINNNKQKFLLYKNKNIWHKEMHAKHPRK